MAHIQPSDDLFKRGEVGDWAFDVDESHILIVLPGESSDSDRPGSFAALAVRKPTLNYSGPVWTWDGNKEAPTLTPSILHRWRNGERAGEWHGYLTNGRLETA